MKYYSQSIIIYLVSVMLFFTISSSCSKSNAPDGDIHKTDSTNNGNTNQEQSSTYSKLIVGRWKRIKTVEYNNGVSSTITDSANSGYMKFLSNGSLKGKEIYDLKEDDHAGWSLSGSNLTILDTTTNESAVIPIVKLDSTDLIIGQENVSLTYMQRDSTSDSGDGNTSGNADNTDIQNQKLVIDGIKTFTGADVIFYMSYNDKSELFNIYGGTGKNINLPAIGFSFNITRGIKAGDIITFKENLLDNGYENLYGSASYDPMVSFTNDTLYSTESSTYTGTLTITSFDKTKIKFSATYQFKAVACAHDGSYLGEKTVTGSIENAIIDDSDDGNW